jgi:hypothetical protein
MLPAEPSDGFGESVRASDADRDRFVAHLREQCGQGRLTLAEFEERVDIVFAARTVADLDHVVRDLPAPLPATTAAPPRLPSEPEARRGRRIGRLLVAILGESTRRGRYQAPPSMTAVALLGECKIDLTKAILTDGHLHVTAVAALGEVTIIVADGVHVDMAGLAVLGEKTCRVDDRDGPEGAPVVTVTAVAVLGEVTVRSLSPRERTRREQRARAS